MSKVRRKREGQACRKADFPKFLDGSPWHASLPRRVDIRSGVGVYSPGSHFWQFAQQRDNEVENEGLECMPYGEGGQKSRDRAGRGAEEISGKLTLTDSNQRR